MRGSRVVIILIGAIASLCCVEINARGIDSAKIQDPMTIGVRVTAPRDSEESSLENNDDGSATEVSQAMDEYEITTEYKYKQPPVNRDRLSQAQPSPLAVAASPSDDDYDEPVARPVRPPTTRRGNRPIVVPRATTEKTAEEVESTTKYKYEKEIQPFIVTQKNPFTVPIQHAAGTYWMQVNQNRDLTEQYLETQRNVFDQKFSSGSRPANEPPPKY